ncbi:flagellar biosynthetic protein FliR [Acidisoma sp.]|uniref:flagellar biosynthetic protein FliR n=1 Tax=Acidisoma sp. TaxID=1872115 RepID=UPI003B004301
MVVTDGQVLTWLGRFVWPFLRITGLFLTAPFFGSALIPMRVKAILAAVLAGALAFWLPNLPAFPGDPITAVYQGIIQIGFGAAIGAVMQIVVASIASLGEIAGLAMGLSFAELQFQDVPGETQVLYDIMSWAALMGFIAVGGPIWLFAAIAHSFQGGTAGLGAAALPALLAFGSSVVTTAVMLAVPVMAISLAINVTVGLLTVFSPQLNLLTIGFPLLILGGLSILTASLGDLPGSIEHLLNTAVRTIAIMVPIG